MAKIKISAPKPKPNTNKPLTTKPMKMKEKIPVETSKTIIKKKCLNPQGLIGTHRVLKKISSQMEFKFKDLYPQLAAGAPICVNCNIKLYQYNFDKKMKVARRRVKFVETETEVEDSAPVPDPVSDINIGIKNLKLKENRVADGSKPASQSSSHVKVQVFPSHGSKPDKIQGEALALHAGDMGNVKAKKAPVPTERKNPASATTTTTSSEVNQVINPKPNQSQNGDRNKNIILEMNKATTNTLIFGQEKAKKALREASGGLLLVGPPGNGKTILAKEFGQEARGRGTIFLYISALDITSKSKYEAEGVEPVRALFSSAKTSKKPSIIFMDDIDSFFSVRKDPKENKAVIKIKNEFLVQMHRLDPLEKNILVMGATSKPQELDDATLMRFPTEIFVGLPKIDTRKEILSLSLLTYGSPLNDSELNELANLTEGYSGSEITELTKDASLYPFRDLYLANVGNAKIAKNVRKIQLDDFKESLKKIRPYPLSNVWLKYLDTEEEDSAHSNVLPKSQSSDKKKKNLPKSDSAESSVVCYNH